MLKLELLSRPMATIWCYPPLLIEKIEDLFENMLLLMMLVLFMVIVVVTLRAFRVTVLFRPVILAMIAGRPLVEIGLHRTLDDLVEFSAVQPDTAAIRTIIDFDPLAICYSEGFVTFRTVHVWLPFISC